VPDRAERARRWARLRILIFRGIDPGPIVPDAPQERKWTEINMEEVQPVFRLPSLARVIHDAWCNDFDPDLAEKKCARWSSGNSVGQAHRDYYQLRAESIGGQLEPVIGDLGVKLAVKVILGEMS
jgi:hypothetical protein